MDQSRNTKTESRNKATNSKIEKKSATNKDRRKFSVKIGNRKKSINKYKHSLDLDLMALGSDYDLC